MRLSNDDSDGEAEISTTVIGTGFPGERHMFVLHNIRANQLNNDTLVLYIPTHFLLVQL